MGLFVYMDTKKEELLEEVTLDEVEDLEHEAVVEEKPAPKPVKEPVLETRRCEDCQGDGKWDGVVCAVCKGSGKIFKDGVVVLTATGETFKAENGELK